MKRATQAAYVKDKPKFALTPIKEIVNEPPNNGSINIISTFAGCGGSSLGYRYNGGTIRWANEVVDEARAVYEANASPYTIVDGRDIRTIDPLEVAYLAGGEVDILDGSPPCSSFSTAGKRHKLWGEAKSYSSMDYLQRTDDLFYEYLRFIVNINPKVFIAENVIGLITGSGKGKYKRLFSAMEECGYSVKSARIDAAWLGVPQLRERLIFLGIRNDLTSKLSHAFPKPLPYYYTVRDVLPHIISVQRGSKPNNWQPSDKPAPAVAVKDRNSSIKAYFSGGGFVETVDMERRKYTIDELRVVCGFPSDFKLSGTYEQQYERLARAVPPPMMQAISRGIISQLQTLKEEG